MHKLLKNRVVQPDQTVNHTNSMSRHDKTCGTSTGTLSRDDDDDDDANENRTQKSHLRFPNKFAMISITEFSLCNVANLSKS